MVTTLVVDASVAGQWYLAEKNTAAALRLFEHEVELIAPEVIVAEIGNVAWKACRRGDIDEDKAMAVLRAFLAVDIRLIPTDELVEQALDLAIRHNQAVYDCLYLALALREECQFVTADGEFYKGLGAMFPNNILWVEDIPAA